MFIQIKKQGQIRGFIRGYKYQLLVLFLIATMSMGSCLMTGKPQLIINTKVASTVVKPIPVIEQVAQVPLKMVDTPSRQTALPKDVPRAVTRIEIAPDTQVIDTGYVDVVQVTGFKKKESLMSCQTSVTFSSTQLRQTGMRSHTSCAGAIVQARTNCINNA